MRLAACVMLLAIASLQSTLAAEIKLDDAWFVRLAQLCDAARYGSRMTAEPICNDLAVLVQKAQEADAKAKEKAGKESGSPEKK